MTSQAAYRTAIRRIKGPHPLPEGGDLVRVSPAVRDALIRAERVEPYTRMYAKNPAAHHAWQFDAGGQGLLFSRLPDTDAPLCELGHADPGSRARALASVQVDLRTQRPDPSNMPSKFALGPCARALGTILARGLQSHSGRARLHFISSSRLRLRTAF